MTNHVLPASPENPSVAKPGAERRRDQRYEVDFRGCVDLDGISYPVAISDLSGGGALISSDVALPAAARLSLTIEEFGTLEAKVVHSGAGFAGLQFLDAHLHRDRLSIWLRTAVASRK